VAAPTVFFVQLILLTNVSTLKLKKIIFICFILFPIRSQLYKNLLY